MPSRGETRRVAGASVTVGVIVGTIAASVEVGMAVGGTIAAEGVAVDRVTGAPVVVQAVRRSKETMMNFFIMNNYMSLRARKAKQTTPRISLLSDQVALLTALACGASVARNDMGYGVAPTKFSAYNASS